MSRGPSWERIRCPEKLAKALWSRHALELSPRDFWIYYMQLAEHSTDPYCDWYSGGALRDYVRAHPGSLPIPADHAIRLLKATIPDARVVGLKMLVLCNAVATTVLLEHMIAAIRINDDLECCGGIYECFEFVRQVQCGQRSISTEQADALRRALSVVSTTNAWESLRHMAGRCLFELNDVVAPIEL